MKTSSVGGAREVERVMRVREDEVEGSPSGFLREGAGAVGAGGGADDVEGRDVGDIMRFWNSRCRASRRSRGVARRAIPSK